MSITKNQLESLQKAHSYDHALLCSGAISPPPEGFYLYYGRRNSKFIDLASATSDEIKKLSAASGRDNEGVYDESYHKVAKMDASNFAVQFDPVRAGLIKIVEEQLLHSRKKQVFIDAEIHELNVYGKNSFFKANKDTPRGKDMLGSLVIIFPTLHKGGELILRHMDHEWVFGANALMTLRPSSLAYVAFSSDIDHEVLKVTSGYRVTLTYNLYSTPSEPDTNATALAITPDPKASDSLQKTLYSLLKSPEFLPDGGTLGFGLVHLYPITFETVLEGGVGDGRKTPDSEAGSEDSVEDDSEAGSEDSEAGSKPLVQYLKGGDAHVYAVCRELKLKPALRMIYDYDWSDGPADGVMMDKIIEEPYYDFYSDETYASHLIDKLGGIPVNMSNPTSAQMTEQFDEDDEEDEMTWITWITPFNSRNQLRDFTLSSGKSYPVIGRIYCSPCLIAHVPPAIDRTC